jgi:hypothetical protein
MAATVGTRLDSYGIAGARTKLIALARIVLGRR